MDFGVQVNVYRTTWQDVAASVLAMDSGDWDSVWFADHYIPPGANPEQEAMTAFEGIAAISAVAGMTQKLRLGNLVLGNTYRNPAHVAKIADRISVIRTPLTPADFVISGLGTPALGASGLIGVAFTYVWAANIRIFFLPCFANALKLAEEIRGNRRRLLAAVLVGVLLATQLKRSGRWAIWRLPRRSR